MIYFLDGKTSSFIRTLAACLFLLLLSLLLASCSSGIFSNASWQQSGLQGQQLRVLAVSSKDSTMLAVGNVQGNIFVSTNAGQKWTEQSSGLPLPDPIYALAFAPDGQKLYAATEKGLFTKTEGATVWQQITAAGLPVTSFTALTFLPDASNVLYVGTSDRGIFVSHDGGTSWQTASGGLLQGIEVHDVSVDPVQDQLWAATSAGVYHSINHGTSWQPLNNGLSSALVVNSVVSAATGGGTPGLLYIGTTHGIFLSHDSGKHWVASSEALAGINIQDILVDFRSSTAGTVSIATNIGVFQSTDAGQNWAPVASGSPRNAAVYALAIGGAGNAQLYAAGSGLYAFPGTGSSIDPTRIFTYLLVAAFFFFLYRMATRGRRTARRRVFQPERDPGIPVSTPPDDSARLAE